jgi:hypothetical protein
MLRFVSVRSIVGYLAVLGLLCSALVFGQAPAAQGQGRGRGGGGAAAGAAGAQGAAPAAGAARGGGGAGQAAPGATLAPLFLKVVWVRPPNQTAQVAAVQENIVDTNVEYKQYGKAAKQLLTTGTPGSDVAPFGVWSGECEGPFVITFRQKSNFVDMTGNANVKWSVKTNGFHVIRPVVKLADGTMLVGNKTFESVPSLVYVEFSLGDIRWIKLDPERIVTVNPGANSGNTNNEIWYPKPDLSKVDEVGFADLMPASGHGTGGYIQLGPIEIYGKSIPR